MSKNTWKIVAAMVVVVLICLFYFIYKGQVLAPENNAPKNQNSADIKEISIGQSQIQVEIADTTEKRTLGLGGRMSMPAETGMLFIFDSPGSYGFWMKDTLIPLDIIWIDENRTITDIKEDILPASFPEVFYPTRPALYVLELNAGHAENHQIKIGDRVNL